MNGPDYVLVGPLEATNQNKIMSTKRLTNSPWHLTALMVYAMDRDCLDLPIQKVVEDFEKKAKGMYETYTDPIDVLLYIPHLLNVTPVEFFIDYILFYAKAHVESGLRSYGSYDKQILKY